MSYIFLNEKGQRIPHQELETVEQMLVQEYIEADDVVLELGARYGTVSVTLNKLLLDPTNHLAVEPDQRVVDALEKNRDSNGCGFNIWSGFISSNNNLSLTRTDHVCQGNALLEGYGSTFSVLEDEDSESPPSVPLSHFSEYKFNTLVADCEGFLEYFFDENPELYTQLDKIIMEEDYPQKCNYELLYKNFHKSGFKHVANCRMGTIHREGINHHVFLKERK